MAGQQTRVVILGAGFGGLELAATLSDELGERADVTLVDRADSFVFGFSKLDFMFDRSDVERVRLPYSDINHPGVQMVRAEVRSIDPTTRTVGLDSGQLQADHLVVALGADLDPAATPGLLAGGQEFYTNAGAQAARERLAEFAGGRVVVAVMSVPYKCPPAPSETVLLLHDFLTERGLRASSTIDLVMPLPGPVPPSPQASEAILAAFAQRGIGWHPHQEVRSVDPARRIITFAEGAELPYDLLLAVPKHRAPKVVVESGLTRDGWVPVDPFTLRTRFPGVFAIGDVASAGTPKAGVFAEGQARIVARQIIDGAGSGARYGGRGVCFMEFGRDQVARLSMTFEPGIAPHGTMDGPSPANGLEKQAFGARRAARWFGRDWRPLQSRP